MIDVVWLDFHCPRCHGVVEVQFAAWKPDGPLDDDAVWICPHCDAEHSLGVAGYVALITQKPDPSDLAANQW